MLIDSHCHLDFPDFEADFADVLTRAKEHGVTHMLSISTELKTFPNVLKIAECHDNIFCTVGVHPNHVDDDDEASVSVEILLDKLNHPKVIGLGEAGLDYHYLEMLAQKSDGRLTTDELKQRQRQGLMTHITAARKADVPLVIHARNADEDMMSILQEEHQKGAFKAILHCYSSGMQLAQTGLELGLYVSFSGIVTFKNAHDIREIAKTIPLDHILVETDAPYLAPSPHRGKRNEPAFTKFTANMLADIKGISAEEIGEITSQNFFRLFTKAQA